MKTATIRIQKNSRTTLDQMGERFIKAWKSGKSNVDVLHFESPAALFRVLTLKRWELIERLQALGASSVRGLARHLGRDVKRVHEDIGLLMEYGLIVRTEKRQICVPYKVIRADFDLRAAA
jgi:predicted transcriptional regulator